MRKKYDNALKYEIFTSKEYAFLDDILLKSKVILDIGAHYGYFSLYALEINPNLNIYALEPIFYEKAKNNLKDYPNVKIFELGVSNQVGEANIFVNEEKTMQSSMFNDNFLNKSKKEFKVNYTTIKNFLDSNEIKQIDLMKMDIEGAEFDVLLNLDEKIYKKINMICMEYHLLSKDFEQKFNILVENLKKIYKTVNIIESKYTKKIGYIIANN